MPDPFDAVILLLAGTCGGFIAGLVGVGGGVVFAPVLFYFFQSTGTAPDLIAPLTLGTSLLCTLTASGVSAWQHHLRASVRWPIAMRVGLLSAAALYLVIALVTTQPWYDRFAFQLVFGGLLLIVALRMLVEKRSELDEDQTAEFVPPSPSILALGGIGSAAGAIAGLAGVGGGIVLVPAFHQAIRLPMRTSVGTSSGAIVIISLIGVTSYAVSGWSDQGSFAAVGYVDVAHGLLLALPAIPGARLGARTAHRVPRRGLSIAFAVTAAVVAGRMLITAFSGF